MANIETQLTRILGDGDCHATRQLRLRERRRGPGLRELFGLNPDGRLVPLFPLGCYVQGGAR